MRRPVIPVVVVVFAQLNFHACGFVLVGLKNKNNIYLFIYYETRTKVHEKEKKHKENTDHRKIQKEIKKHTHHEKH